MPTKPTLVSTKKTYTVRFAAVNKKTFEYIRSGKKKIETRANTAKYKTIKAGDVLVCVCAKEKIEKRIKRVRRFKSIRGLLRVYTASAINPEITTYKETEEMYYSFPGYKEKIQQFGIVALELYPGTGGVE